MQAAQHAAVTAVPKESQAIGAAVPQLASQSAASHHVTATAEEAADEDEPETLPLLARRVMAGRQSIVPAHAKVAHMTIYA